MCLFDLHVIIEKCLGITVAGDKHSRIYFERNFAILNLVRQLRYVSAGYDKWNFINFIRLHFACRTTPSLHRVFINNLQLRA